MQQEYWKDINGWNHYQVSSFGRVRSTDRLKYNKGNGAFCKIKGKILRPNKDRAGYEYVTLYQSGQISKRKSIKIHRLVAEHFCEKKDDSLEVNHKNGIKDCNYEWNLEWVTRSENMRDTYKRGRNTNGEKNNASKLMDRDIGIIASLYNNGVSQPIIAKAFGVSQPTISNIIKNKHYKNGLIDDGLAIDINTINK